MYAVGPGNARILTGYVQIPLKLHHTFLSKELADIELCCLKSKWNVNWNLRCRTNRNLSPGNGSETSHRINSSESSIRPYSRNSNLLCPIFQIHGLNFISPPFVWMPSMFFVHCFVIMVIPKIDSINTHYPKETMPLVAHYNSSTMLMKYQWQWMLALQHETELDNQSQ